ncbi:hypothetical protein NDI52_31210 [Leptolyngbya sp. PL-A3]|uniref:hypothetical protein n=1 Tax=Leptolyngbya sp. PL-A3 TaxID=2933911 RepID=UPI0032982794
MRNPKNRLHDLEQKLQRRPVQKADSAQGKKPKPEQRASVEAMSFDDNEPIDLQYDQKTNRYVPNAPTYATAHSVMPDMGLGSEAFEVESFDLEPPSSQNQTDTNSSTQPASTQAAGSPARAFGIDTPASGREVSVPNENIADRFLDNLQAIARGEKTYDGDRQQVVDVSASAPSTGSPVSPIQPEVVSPGSNSAPTKSAAPSAQSFAVDALTTERGTSKGNEVITENDFLEDLQAILGSKKTDDSNRDQSANSSTSAPSQQLSVPPSPPPAPVEPPQQTSPHDVFDRMAQGVPPQPKAPTAEPAPSYSSAHSVFDRMGKNMAFANSFDLGTVPLQQRFDEFDRILEAEEKGQSQSKAAAFDTEAHSLPSEDESTDTLRDMSRPFAKEQEKNSYETTYVIAWKRSKEAGIHKYQSGNPDVVRSGGIFGQGIAVRVPFSKAIQVNRKRESSDLKYVWCKYNGIEGYINKAYILGPSGKEETIRQILNSPILIKGLEAYLKRELATENLEFLLALKNLQNISEVDQVPQLNEILMTYVVPNASKQVNLPNIQFDQSTRRIKASKIKFDQIIEEQPHDTAQYVETMEPLLNWASETIIQLLATDKLSGFIKSFSSTDIQEAFKEKALEENLRNSGLLYEEPDNHTEITRSLSNSEYSEPFSITTAYVVEWRKPRGVGIHKYQSGNPDVVRSGGIFGTGIAARVSFGEAIQIDWERKTSDPKYVWCKYKGTEGYINKDYILELKASGETLDQVLSSPVLLAGFNVLVEKEFVTENLKFLLSLKELENIPRTEIAQSLDKLFTQYLLSNAVEKINISGSLYQEFEQIAQALRNPDRYDYEKYVRDAKPLLGKARFQVLSMLKPRFMNEFLPKNVKKFGSINLEQVLDSPVLPTEFEAFVKAGLISESVNFLRELKKLEAISQSEEVKPEAVEQLNQIFQRFLLDQSPDFINIPHELTLEFQKIDQARRKLDQYLGEVEFHIEKAKNEVVKMLVEQGAFFRFIQEFSSPDVKRAMNDEVAKLVHLHIQEVLKEEGFGN